MDSLLSEPPGKPKDTGVVSLSLLQRIFPTEESNQCGRWILYTSLRFRELCTHMVPMSVLVSDAIVLCAHTENTSL